MNKQQITKLYTKSVISMLCMFIRVNDVTNVEKQFSHSKFLEHYKFVKTGQEHQKTLLKIFSP